jgi:hypothetical protein
MFWWDWSLNSGLHTCKAGSLLFEAHLHPILLWLFWRWGSQELFAQAGLKLTTHLPQPSQVLGLQACITTPGSVFVFFVTVLFHLVYCPQGLLMLQHGTGFPSFQRLNPIPLYDRVHVVHLFIHQWTLGDFPLWAIVNKTAVNMGVQMYLQDLAFKSFGCTSMSRMPASYGNSMFNLIPPPRASHILG